MGASGGARTQPVFIELMTKRPITVLYGDGHAETWPNIDESTPQRRACARPKLQQSRYCFRRLRARPFWRSDDAGEPIRELCASFEASFDAIKKEAVRLLPRDDDDEDEDDGDDAPSASWEAQREGLHSGVWLRCPLWRDHPSAAKNRDALPTLSDILSSSNAVMNDAPGRVYLSFMLSGGSSGTAVAPHAGPTNHRLRVHLPLIIPTTAGSGKRLGISVGGEWREWEEGRCLVLDDSFVHSVDLRGATTNSISTPSASTTRLLLVCDVRHPDASLLDDATGL